MRIIANRKIFYIISIVLLLPGIVSLFMQGINTGIDFIGGTSLSYQIAEATEVAEVRQVLLESGVDKDFQVQQSDGVYYLRSLMLSQEEIDQLTASLAEVWPDVELLRSDSVGAAIGKEITTDAFLSVLIACLAILIYISLRFKWDYGVASVLALLHNVLFVLGIFSIFQWEINSPFIAAILTVVGYTINDTIVVFDRLRENMANRSRKEDYASLVDISVGQTINRSINTVLTCLMPLIALLLLSGSESTIGTFVLAMILGFSVGAYTSLCIATSWWYEIKSRTKAA